MRKVKLEEICHINPKVPPDLRTDPEKMVSFLPMKSLLTNGNIIDPEERLTKDVLKGFKYFEEGDVLFAKITPCMENGKAGLVRTLKHRYGFGSTEFHVMRPKSELSSEFLHHLMRQPKFRYLAEKRMTGAGGQRRVPADFLKSYEIILPAIDDQNRIAHALSKVEALIARRKESLQQLDELLKSVFLNMFGDPVNNQHSLTIGTIGDLITEAKYGTSSPANNGEFKYLRMNNITTEGHWNYTSLKSIDVSDKDLPKYSLKEGDVVFNRTNSKELVGKTAVYDSHETVVIAGYLIRMRCNEKANPWFIWGHLNSQYGKAHLRSLCRNIVGMANINAKELQRIPITLPDLKSQNQFGEYVQKILKLRTMILDSIPDYETLYNALSQKAFKGKLTLSQAPFPNKELIPSTENPADLTNDGQVDQPHSLSTPSSKELDPVYDREKLIDYGMTEWLHLSNEVLSEWKEKIFTTSELWEKIEAMDPKTLPHKFSNYKKWILKSLESQDGPFEQVFDITDTDKKNKVYDKSIGLKVKDDFKITAAL